MQYIVLSLIVSNIRIDFFPQSHSSASAALDNIRIQIHIRLEML
jgi:hypothetical protein